MNVQSIQKAFGYTYEICKDSHASDGIKPDAEATAAMGIDTPLAVLSDASSAAV